MNEINARQNKQENLDRLYAVAKLYSLAKRYKYIEFFLSTILIVIISLLKIFYYKFELHQIVSVTLEQLSPYLALSTFILAFTNSYLIRSKISNYVKLAAIIQYEFDSIVLSIIPNPILQTQFVSTELIRKYSKKIRNKENFLDWYSTKISAVDKEVGMFLCLRSNFSWDSELRKRYSNLLTFFTITVALISFVISFVTFISIHELILNFIIPIYPLFIFIRTEQMGNKTAIDIKESIRKELEKVSKKVLQRKISKDEILIFSICFSESLFHLRKENPLIPDFFYRRYRMDDEDAMNYSINNFLKEME